MDSKDTEILKVLEKDARVPAKDMAVMLDIPEKEVTARIDALKKNGIIRKFNTTIDWKRAGVEKVYAILQVKVVPQERSGFARIAKEISKDSRVVGVYVATGEYDLMVYVQGNNIDEISEFTTDKLAPKKDIVGTNTHIILKIFKKDGVEFFDDEVERLKISL
ncbi:MAG: hypothetical protein A7315_11750 [Candidatus Altiarchaeales archaeon WOR_SM1_79]|nr:MAG: hypothetical protein A7315_11750 [Candidatus Altiarchaeales archaeon WOR_SM1_79]